MVRLAKPIIDYAYKQLGLTEKLNAFRVLTNLPQSLLYYFSPTCPKA
jgi:hypothetical protein